MSCAIVASPQIHCWIGILRLESCFYDVSSAWLHELCLQSRQDFKLELCPESLSKLARITKKKFIFTIAKDGTTTSPFLFNVTTI